MVNERLTEGVERIERALVRIRAAAASTKSPPRDEAELNALRARHEGLKAEVARAMNELDAIAGG